MKLIFVFAFTIIGLHQNALIRAKTHLKQQEGNQVDGFISKKGNVFNEFAQYSANPNSHLSYARQYDISRVQNPEKDGFEYLKSDKFLSWDEIRGFEKQNVYEYDHPDCLLNRVKILDKINLIRQQHSSPALRYDNNLENQAKAYAEKMKLENDCLYDQQEASHFSELFTTNYKRLSEVDVIEKWYSSVYSYDFKIQTFTMMGINAYPMLNILWDTMTSVGCSRVCCASRELYICDFYPVLIQPGLEEISKHIHPNKYFAEGTKKLN